MTLHIPKLRLEQTLHRLVIRWLSVAFLMLSQLLTFCPSDALASGLVKDRPSVTLGRKSSQPVRCYSCPLWHTPDTHKRALIGWELNVKLSFWIVCSVFMSHIFMTTIDLMLQGHILHLYLKLTTLFVF